MQAPVGIRATIKKDDNELTVNFDAVNWFKHASWKRIIRLIKQDFNNSEIADEVAGWHIDKNPAVKDFFDRLGLPPTGYEVYINQDDAWKWLKDHRREIYDAFYDRWKNEYKAEPFP